MKPNEILRTTPKQFKLLMDAAQEKIYDELEHESIKAIMYGKAANPPEKKKIGPKDLFDRKTATQDQGKTQENMREKIRRQQEWVDRLNIGKGGEHGK